MSDKKFAYSEIFYSIQGEGHYTGVGTAWFRFFMCNLQCNGFGQKDPTEESTYQLPYKDFDPKSVERVEDLPVWQFGCDSSYSWAAKFKHLQQRKTAAEICDQIQETMKTDTNPEGLFLHPWSGTEQHMCFTGGEPLMPHAQEAVIEILKEFKRRGNEPLFITFETNGTQKLTDAFIDYINGYYYDTEIFFSVSPKLFTVAGEKNSKAIKPAVVAGYKAIEKSNGQLKFVVGKEDRQWEELDRVVGEFRTHESTFDRFSYGPQPLIDWPVWIMPVSATMEDQLDSAGDVATIAFHRGYNVSARVHCYLWGNAIGV